jgi:hypothetical protein
MSQPPTGGATRAEAPPRAGTTAGVQADVDAVTSEVSR